MHATLLRREADTQTDGAPATCPADSGAREPPEEADEDEKRERLLTTFSTTSYPLLSLSLPNLPPSCLAGM